MRQFRTEQELKELAAHIDHMLSTEGWAILKERLDDEISSLQLKINELDPTRTRLEENTLKAMRNAYEHLLAIPEELKTMAKPLIDNDAEDLDPYEKPKVSPVVKTD